MTKIKGFRIKTYYSYEKIEYLKRNYLKEIIEIRKEWIKVTKELVTKNDYIILL